MMLHIWGSGIDRDYWKPIRQFLICNKIAKTMNRYQTQRDLKDRVNKYW